VTSAAAKIVRDRLYGPGPVLVALGRHQVMTVAAVAAPDLDGIAARAAGWLAHQRELGEAEAAGGAIELGD